MLYAVRTHCTFLRAFSQGATGPAPLQRCPVCESDPVYQSARGEFDLSNVREVEAAAFEAVDGGVRELCLNVREVTFMDSTMLNLLVNLQKRLRERGGALRIQPNIAVTQLLELTGLGGLFDLVGDGD